MRLGDMLLAAASVPEEEDVRLLQLEDVAPDGVGLLVLERQVVVVQRDRVAVLGVRRRLLRRELPGAISSIRSSLLSSSPLRKRGLGPLLGLY